MFPLSQSSFVQFFTRNRFRKDMTFIIFLKIILLFLLWEFFFSHPVAEQLTPSLLAQHFIPTKTAPH